MSISQNMSDQKATKMVPIVLYLWVNNKFIWKFWLFEKSVFWTALIVHTFVNLDTYVCWTDRQNAYNEFPILMIITFMMWMTAATMVLMAMVTKRLLQLRPLQELHNLEAPAIQSVCGASGEKTEALSLSTEKAGTLSRGKDWSTFTFGSIQWQCRDYFTPASSFKLYLYLILLSFFSFP